MSKYTSSLVILIPALVLFAHRLEAAPAPGAGSSVLVSPLAGLFYSARGFTLSAPAEWTIDSKFKDLENNDSTNANEIEIAYLNPRLPNSRVSVKTNTLKSELSLEAYAKKWMKDYSSYGFDVLGAKTFFSNSAKGLVVDLVHRKQGQQLRQVIFLKKKTAVTLTCLDKIENFDASLTTCNQILKTFAWKGLPSTKN